MRIKRRYLYHAFAWLLFIIYEISVIIVITGKTNAMIDYALHFLCNILFFYVNASLILKYAFTKNNKIKLILFIVLELAILLISSYWLNFTLQKLHIPVSKPTASLRLFIIPGIWRGFYFFGLSCGYAFAKNLVKSNLQIIDLQQQEINHIQKQNLLETDLLKLRNAYLKVQINPHLLFNTLNFIYNTVRKTSRESGEAVMYLSEITRYSYMATNNPLSELVLIEDELEQIRNLVALNQIRFNHQLNIDLDVEPVVQDQMMIPIVLLTLVENVFKYGDLRSTDKRGLISAKITDDNILEFRTFNKKQKGKPVKTSDQTGIKNIIYRLDNHYLTNYKLNIVDNEDDFEVLLTVKVSA